MNILIDTHIALWSMYNDKRLSKVFREYLIDGDIVIYISLISAWEIAIKYSIGKLKVPADEFLRDCKAMGYRELSLSREHIKCVQHLPFGEEGHKDPFDRLLLAQADSEGMRFLTEDRRIQGYDIPAVIRQ